MPFFPWILHATLLPSNDMDPIRWSASTADSEVASGHYEFPYCPELPGQKEWLAASSERKILHALSYNDPEDEPIRTAP